MIAASPKPSTPRIVKRPLTENVYCRRIEDVSGDRVAALSPHPSFGGRGLEQATVDGRLIIAIANSPAAAAFEASPGNAAAVDIPPTEQAPAGPTERLL